MASPNGIPCRDDGASAVSGDAVIEALRAENALLRAENILSSRENPKICGIDDAEVVGDLVAVDMPVPRHLLAQKS